MPAQPQVHPPRPQRPLHLTLVCPFDPQPPRVAGRQANVGGVERVFAEVSRQLARGGHKVTLLCSTDGAPGRSEEHGVEVVRQRRLATVFRDPVCRLATAIPDGTDLVHVAATYPFTTPAVLRYARRRGISAVLDFHFEPHLASWMGRLAAKAYGVYGPPSYALADAVLVRSMAYAQAASTLAGVPPGRLRVVPNGFDPDRFTPQGPRREGDYLLFVGRLVPYKGLEVLLRALSEARLPQRLVVAGDGPLRPALEAQASGLGLPVDFLGHVPDADLPGLYRGARLTLLPSVNGQEAFGIALAESMACGTPVVASALPGVEEVARLGGLVAPPGDAGALAARIAEALQPGRLPRGPELAAQARRRYSWEAVAQAMLDVYAEVLAPREPTPQEVVAAAHLRRDPVL